MKQQKFMTKIIFALALAVMTAVPTASLRAQSSDEPISARNATQGGGILDVLDQIKEAQAQQLEGSWVITINLALPPGVPPPPPIIAHATISRGGALFGSDRAQPTSKQHGAWAHLGSNDFAFTAVEDIFDATGNFAGTLTVRVKLSVTGKDQFVGVSNGEQRDAAGNLVFNACGTLRGQRIKVEPLPLQCQSITPPQ